MTNTNTHVFVAVVMTLNPGSTIDCHEESRRHFETERAARSYARNRTFKAGGGYPACHVFTATPSRGIVDHVASYYSAYMHRKHKTIRDAR